VDFEGELGVVVGARLSKAASEEEALAVVSHYTIVNDVTARDLQKKDGQWTRGKGYDTFCPVGPWLVPAAEVEVGTLRVITRVNGEVKQDAPVSDMIFSVGAILHYVSQFMTLEPGDLIATGTPPGVGPVVAGDLVEVEIPGLGMLINRVVAG
jgi:2-keto-4-pentenoate hydratase/2-oxohepta-3-ene-1,7-dioic acid hydratase in catechol pathway